MPELTIFHRILAKEIPAAIVLEDDECVAFKDIHPKATTHLLFVPKQYLQSVAHVDGATKHIPGMLILKAQTFAKQQGIEGYKLTFHVGKDGGQEVPYIHLHFLSDKALS